MKIRWKNPQYRHFMEDVLKNIKHTKESVRKSVETRRENNSYRKFGEYSHSEKSKSNMRKPHILKNFISTKVKISCPICKTIHEQYPSRIKSGVGTCCSQKCRGILFGLRHKGENHPLWKGGYYDKFNDVEKKIRKTIEYKQWREKIFTRDDFTCVSCGSRGVFLHAHHIKTFAILLKEAKEMFSLLSLYDAAMLYVPLWDTNNGITYCDKDHKEHHKQLKVMQKMGVYRGGQ